MRASFRTIAGAAALLLAFGCGGGDSTGNPAAQVVELAQNLLADPAAQDADADPAENGDGGLTGALGRALGGGEEAGDSEEKNVYYRYTDANGSMHFVQSLAEVPASARASARAIETKKRRPPPEPRQQARARPKAWTTTLNMPTPTRRSASRDVVVYTAPWCGWCRKTIAYLDQKGVDYDNRDIDANPSYKAELRRKSGGTSIPVTEVGGELIRGFNKAALDRALSG